MAEMPPSNRPKFERSCSGRRWLTALKMKHLTPMCLQLTLPNSYPSQEAPSFSLSCLWLTATQLGALCQQMDKLWEEMHGMPIIYTWVDWLENNALNFLGITDTIIISPPIDFGPDQSIIDQRAIPECSDLESDILTMLRYSAAQELEEFHKSQQECEICFEEKQGFDFFRLSDCKHHFCRECMTGFCQMHVKEGTVQQLRCPNNECKETLPPFIVREVLGEEEYIRWERLLLQRALETLGDVDWCPRCNSPATREENFAHCTYCTYSFCTQCREPSHKGSRCSSIEEKIQKLESEMRAVGIDENVQCSQRRKRELIKELLLSKEQIDNECKRCPKCQAPIYKFSGCNKVVCTNCSTMMCFLCGKKIQGYDHFQDAKCELFAMEPLVIHRRQLQPRPRHEGAVRVEAQLEEDPNAKNNLMKCLNCKQPNIRQDKNNHIKCWCCKINMCFMCKKRFQETVTQHYTSSKPCQQHTD
ncbi:E3 ubiquitin-protein ligase RNF14 isoform X2 [Lingula anatina]|nr:E3 ubiquitin-protein ligase RNF14 isoform X2 [Lingula anatina]|eukprot:XP_013407485.1 E3 ubiquitin-protein ligase RNF14 isoform X2 [Lingula anatina]